MKRNNLSITVVTTLIVFFMLSPISAMSAPFDDEGNIDRAERMQMRLKVIERYLGIVESNGSVSVTATGRYL